MADKLYNFQVNSIGGKEVSMSSYEGKTLLIVNTASKCGLTPQYKQLEELYKNHKDKGLEILGFPCNQFGSQEPGDEKEINEFCEINYGVSFPMFAKVEVNGKNTHPLFEYLKNEKPGLLGLKAIKWNFTKFLIDKTGKVIKRYAPTTEPVKIEKDITDIL